MLRQFFACYKSVIFNSDGNGQDRSALLTDILLVRPQRELRVADRLRPRFRLVLTLHWLPFHVRPDVLPALKLAQRQQ